MTPAVARTENRALAERRAFYLENLGEAVRDLYQTSQPRRILDACLLSAMGPTAAESGFMLVLDARADRASEARQDGQATLSAALGPPGPAEPQLPALLAARGMAPAFSPERLAELLESIRELATASSRTGALKTSSAPGEPWAVRIDARLLSDLGRGLGLPSGLEMSPDAKGASAPKLIGVAFRCDFRRYGLLVLSGRYAEAGFGREEAEYLESLGRMGAVALRHAYALGEARQMSADVARKNSALADALRSARERGASLDRETFRLRSLLEAGQEMNAASAPETLLDAFLLGCMGGFGARNGYVMLLDRSSGSSGHCLLSSRDGHDVRPLSASSSVLAPEDCEKFLYRSFSAMPDKTLKPMSVGFPRARLSPPWTNDSTEALLSHDEGTDDAEPASPGDLQALFVLDERRLGMVGLSGLPGAASESDGDGPATDADADRRFLEAHILGLLPRLDACLAMQTIRELNDDLARRNQELEASLRALSEARTAITGLESAMAEVRESLRQAGERTVRATAWDFCLLFAATLILGLLYNFVSPHGLKLVPELWRQETSRRAPVMPPAILAARLAEGSAIAIDARPAELFEAERIRGAVNLPAPLFDFTYMLRAAGLARDADLVVYGATISRLYDWQVAEKLRARGHERVYVLDGGRSGWKGAKLPVETGPDAAPARSGQEGAR